ncbi:MAG TPA: hypothetical protein VGJ94_15350 [Syntrophorhabdaceae bacterium]|jgi:uncharacterized protein involved in exopolysaccharide biosynthesis
MYTEHSRKPVDLTDARDVATIIFKHKYIILISFLVIFIGVTIYARSLPRLYEAKSVLLVKFGREFLQRPEEPKSASAPSIPPQAILNGEMNILTSRDVLTRAAENAGPENLYPELGNVPKEGLRRTQAAVAKIEKDLKVTILPGTSLIEIVFAHKDPSLAAKTVNLLVDYFKEKHLEVFSGAGTPFLENKMKATQTKLSSAEGEFADFRKKYGVFSFEEQRSTLISQRSALEASLRAAQTQRGELQQRAAWIKSSAWIPTTIVEIRAPLLVLEQKERELLDKYTSGSRAVQAVRQEIEHTKASIGRNIEMLRQAEFQKAEGEVSVVNTRIEGLNKQTRQLEADIQTLDTHGRTVQNLKREVAENEQSHQAYVKKLEESQIMDDMDRRKMAAISVVEKAWSGSAKKKQRFTQEQMMGFGILAGIAGGVGLAFLLELLASGMTLPHGAERRLDIPVLVAIPNKRLGEA